MRRSWSVWLGNVLQSSRGRSGSAILSAHDIQMAELDASWRAALAHVCFTAKGRGPKVGAARGAEFKVIPHCGFGRSRARNTNIPRRTQNRICTDMYAQASVYTCSRVGRICRHRSQATSFDGRQLTRDSTQKILVLSPAFTQGLFQVVLSRFLDARRWCGERGSERALASIVLGRTRGTSRGAY